MPYHAERDPLSQLINSLVTQKTRNADSSAAFRSLRERFPEWQSVIDAPVSDVEAAIARANWPEQKAPRIQTVLRAVAERAGQLSLDFLAGIPVAAALAWLENLPGIGPKTAAATLLFSRLRIPALPVDSHHHRVAIRLGLIAPKTSEARAHPLLRAMWPDGTDAQTLYDHHEVMMFHGQRCCFAKNPACGRCVLLDLCPAGQERLRSAG